MSYSQQPFHFFASSIGEWRVSDDLETLIKGMKRSRLSFALWKVPGPKHITYDISTYSPMVEGRVYLGMYETTAERKNKWKVVCEERR